MKKTVLLFLFLSSLLYSKTVHTTSLKVEKTNDSEFVLSFNSDAKEGFFQLYRSDWGAIRNLKDVENSDLVFEGFLKGKKQNTNYFFQIKDRPEKSGTYFYLIRYGNGKVKASEIKPEINANTQALLFKPLKEKGEVISNSVQKDAKVKTVFLRVEEDRVLVFWEMNRNLDDESLFRVYRIREDENPSESLKRSPDIRIKNDFFYEDRDLKIGKAWRYLVLYGTNSNIEEGRNLSSLVCIGAKRKITIEKKRMYQKVFLKFDQKKPKPLYLIAITNRILKIGKKTIKKVQTNRFTFFRSNQTKSPSKRSSN